MKRFVLILLAILCVGNISLEATALRYTASSASQSGSAPDYREETSKQPQITDLSYRKIEKMPSRNGDKFETVETTTLQCLPPENWGGCYVYWWGSETECASWPGMTMTTDVNGTYRYDVPSDAECVVFSSVVHNGEINSAERPMPAKPCDKIYVVHKGMWCEPGEIDTEGDAFYVAGSARLCGREWDPAAPANRMEWLADGVYYKTYYDVLSGVYELMVTTDLWQRVWCDDLPGTDMGQDAYRLEISQTTDVTVYFNSYRGEVSVSLGSPGYSILYCLPPASWSDCYVFWWNSVIDCAQWPGEKMELDSNGIYGYHVPVDAEFIIFHNGDGYQTPDLLRPASKGVQYNILSERWSLYGINAEYPVTYYVSGDEALCGSVWEPHDQHNQMTQNEMGIWTKCYQDVNPGTYRLCVTDGTFENVWNDSTPGKDGTESTYVLELTVRSDVTVIFNKGKETVRVEIRERPGYLHCLAPEDWENCNVYWWGSQTECGEWPGEAMTWLEGNIWGYEVPRDATYVIFNNHDASGSGGMQTYNLVVPADDYSMYLIDRDEWTQPSNVIGGQFYVLGSMELCGSDWSPNDPQNQMTGDGKGGWLKVYYDVQPGAYLLNVGDGTYINNWADHIPGEDDFPYEFTLDSTEDVYVFFDAVEEIVMVSSDGPSMPADSEIREISYRVVGNADFMGNENPTSDAGLMSEIETNVYQVTFDNVEEGNYQFRITENGSFSRRWGTGGGKIGFALTAQKSKVRVTFTKSGGLGFVKVESTQIEAAVSGKTVYCQAPDNWETCYVYWWGTGAGPAWPGVAMTKGADGIWSYEIPEGATNVIFNKGGADGQTGDLDMPKDDKTQYVVESNQWVVPGIKVEIVKSYYVTGSASLCGVEFRPADANNRMTEGENGVWTKIYKAVPAGEYQLMITDGSWNNTWYDDQPGTDGGYDSYQLKLEATADVKVTFDSVNEIVTVETGEFNDDTTTGGDDTTGSNSGTTGEADKDVAGTLSAFRVVGNAPWMGNWDPASDAGRMQEVAPGVYKKSFENVQPGNYEFKITKDGTWANSWGDNGNNFCFTLQEACTITVTFIFDGQNGKIEVKGIGMGNSCTDGDDDTTTTTGEYYLVGYINGADYDGTDYKFVNGKVTVTFTADSYVFVKSGDVSYMTDDWQGNEVTSVTLSDSSTLVNAEKLFAPMGKTLTFTVAENADGTLTLSYVVAGDDTTSPGGNTTTPGGNNSNTQTPAGSYKITVKVPASWNSCYLYAWADGVDSNADWPGVAMTKGADGSWSAELETKFNKIIITEKDGGAQTVDLDAPGKATTIILKAEPNAEGKFEVEGSVSTPGSNNNNTNTGSNNSNTNTGNNNNNTNPGDNNDTGSNSGTTGEADKDVAGTLSAFRVVGNAPWMGNWDPASDAGRMQEVAPGVYKKSFENVQPGNYEFKITKDGTWANSWGDDGNNFCFTLQEACTITVTFIFDGQNGKIEVEGIGMGIPGTDGDDDTEEPEDIFRVVGNAPWMGNGDPGNDVGIMTQVGPRIYLKVFENVPKGVYKLVITRNGSGTDYWGTSGRGSEPYVFTVEDTTNVLVKFDLDTEVIYVKIDGVEDSNNDNTQDPDYNMQDFVGNTQNSGDSTQNPGRPIHPDAPETENPDVTLPTEHEETLPTESDRNPTQPTQEWEPALSPLVNPAIHSFNIIWFGCVAVCIYCALLLIKHKRLAAAETTSGRTVVTMAPLSLKDTEKLVAENPTAPSAALDQRIMESIQKLNK